MAPEPLSDEKCNGSIEYLSTVKEISSVLVVGRSWEPFSVEAGREEGTSHARISLNKWLDWVVLHIVVQVRTNTQEASLLLPCMKLQCRPDVDYCVQPITLQPHIVILKEVRGQHKLLCIDPLLIDNPHVVPLIVAPYMSEAMQYRYSYLAHMQSKQHTV